MAKYYRMRATRDYPDGRPYISGTPGRLTFSSVGSLFSGRDAFRVWKGVHTNRPRSHWIMEPADE